MVKFIVERNVIVGRRQRHIQLQSNIEATRSRLDNDRCHGKDVTTLEIELAEWIAERDALETLHYEEFGIDLR